MEAPRLSSTSPFFEPLFLGEPMELGSTSVDSSEVSRSAEIVAKVFNKRAIAPEESVATIDDLIVTLCDAEVTPKSVFVSDCPQTPNRLFKQEYVAKGVWRQTLKREENPVTESETKGDAERDVKRTHLSKRVKIQFVKQ